MKEERPEEYAAHLEIMRKFEEDEARFDHPTPLLIRSAVDVALENLEILKDEDSWFPSYALYDPKKVYEALVRITCPTPCVGYVNETGWHKLCVARADKAFEAIFEYKFRG